MSDRRSQTICAGLEHRLADAGLKTPQLFLMQSNGGLMRISLGARHPNQTLLSGPAAGVIAGAELARVTQRRQVVTFDMGGTSTDISVIVDGRLLETTQGQIAGQDIGTPMLKVRTLGAGGGTIAWIGKDGLLKVGPRQRRARCRARPATAAAATEPTVTDANVVLGALSGDTVLAGTLRLDAERAGRAIESGRRSRSGSMRSRARSASCASSTPRWRSTCASRCRSRDRTRASSPWSPSAAPGRCMRRRWRAASAFRACSCRRSPGLNCAIGMLQTNVRHSYLKSEIGRARAGFRSSA